MGKTKNATKPLTQEEIWDDSALVRSWDEAVEEYKVRLVPEICARDLHMVSDKRVCSFITAFMQRVRMLRMF